MKLHCARWVSSAGRRTGAIPVLGLAVRTDGRESVVTCAINALAEIGGPEVFPALVGARRLPAGVHRRDAAVALGRVGDLTATPVLEALRGDDEQVTKYTALCPSYLRNPAGRYAKDAIKAITRRRPG